MVPSLLQGFSNFVSGHLQKKAATKKSKAISELLCGSFSIVIAGNIGFAQNGENILEAIRICQRTENITLHFIGKAPINDGYKTYQIRKTFEECIFTHRLDPASCRMYCLMHLQRWCHYAMTRV